MSIRNEELTMSYYWGKDPQYVLEEVGNYYEIISVCRADRRQQECTADPPITNASELPYSLTL